jgi:hypothetical protein
MNQQELPTCRWRGDRLSEGYWACHSPKLVVPARGVTADNCARCFCRDHEPLEAPARLLQLGISAAVAAAKHVATGMKQVDEETYKKRRETCDACEHHEPVQDRCLKCGCYLEAALLKKLRMASESCPIGKW